MIPILIIGGLAAAVTGLIANPKPKTTPESKIKFDTQAKIVPNINPKPEAENVGTVESDSFSIKNEADANEPEKNSTDSNA